MKVYGKVLGSTTLALDGVLETDENHMSLRMKRMFAKGKGP